MAIEKKLQEKILDAYPAKVMRNRKKHLLIRESDQKQEIAANTRTVPGIITNRGCCFAGCKGVVIGPIVDMVHVVHGPIGCAYYSWGTGAIREKPGPAERISWPTASVPICRRAISSSAGRRS